MVRLAGEVMVIVEAGSVTLIKLPLPNARVGAFIVRATTGTVAVPPAKEEVIVPLLITCCVVVTLIVLSLLTVAELPTVTVAPEIFSGPPLKFIIVVCPAVTD